MKEMDCDMFISAFDSYNLCLTGDVGRTLSTPSGSLNEHISPILCLNFQGSKGNNMVTDNGTAYSLNAMHGHDAHVVCYEDNRTKVNNSDG